MKNRRLILSLVLSLVSGSVFSQDFHVFLHNVEEDRFWGESSYRSQRDTLSKIILTTMINGLQLDEDHLIKMIDAKAEDNQGKELRKLSDPFWGDRPARYQSDKEVQLIFKAPTRHATQMRLVEGTIRYFTPTEENEAKMVIFEFTRRYNENLLAGFSTGMKLILIEADSLQALVKAKEQALREKIELVKSEQKKDGKETDAEVDLALSILRSILSSNNADPDKTLNFHRNDDGEPIYEINVYNGSGEKINTGYTFSEDLYQIRLNETPAAGCRIEVIRENKAAVKELKFKLTGIYLP